MPWAGIPGGSRYRWLLFRGRSWICRACCWGRGRSRVTRSIKVVPWSCQNPPLCKAHADGLTLLNRCYRPRIISSQSPYPLSWTPPLFPWWVWLFAASWGRSWPSWRFRFPWWSWFGLLPCWYGGSRSLRSSLCCQAKLSRNSRRWSSRTLRERRRPQV